MGIFSENLGEAILRDTSQITMPQKVREVCVFGSGGGGFRLRFCEAQIG